MISSMVSARAADTSTPAANRSPPFTRTRKTEAEPTSRRSAIAPGTSDVTTAARGHDRLTATRSSVRGLRSVRSGRSSPQLERAPGDGHEPVRQPGLQIGRRGRDRARRRRVSRAAARPVSAPRRQKILRASRRSIGGSARRSRRRTRPGRARAGPRPRRTARRSEASRRDAGRATSDSARFRSKASRSASPAATSTTSVSTSAASTDRRPPGRP